MPIEQVQIQTLQSGALVLPNETFGYISLSHSFDFVAIAVSSVPVGLDMEKMRPKNNFNEILEQIDAVVEAKDLMSQGFPLQESFFRLWTKKEAVYKLNSVMSALDRENIFYSYHQSADFMLCVATPKLKDVVWENILFEKC